MAPDIDQYHQALPDTERSICNILYETISSSLPEAEARVWHGSPVWFIEGNPITGYSNLKDGIRLLFWSGQSFDEPDLKPEGKFKAAEVRYPTITSIRKTDLRRWLKKARTIQWDYKNIVKKKGRLERIIIS